MITTPQPDSNPQTLPTPVERPEAAVVIYDGHCKFCSAQVRRLARWDHRGHLAFLSFHEEQFANRYPDLSHDDLMREMHVVDQAGNVYRGAVAFRWLTRRLPRLWLIAPLLHVPLSLPIWQWLYRQIAKRRYRLGRTDSCDNGTCRIHFD